MPEIDTSQIPPQAIQAMQQSGMQGGDITSILAQLAQMSPDEVSQALAQLGVQIDPDTLAQAASDWVDRAADNSSGATPSDASAPAAAEGEDEATPAQPSPSAPTDEEGGSDVEGDEAVEAQASASPSDVAQARAMASGARAGGGSVPPTGGASMARMTGGVPDELISAMMAQQIGGDANMPLPRGAGVGGPRMRAPTVAPRGGAGAIAPGGDPAMKQMIGSIYRDLAATNRTGAPTGPRTGAPSNSLNPSKRRKKDA